MKAVRSMSEGKYIKVDVYSVDREVILSSKNYSIEGNRIILKGDHLPKMEHKAVIKAVGYLEDGIVMMEGKVTISTEMQINIEILDKQEKEDRRQSIKVRTEFRSRILKAYRSGKSRKGLLINEEMEARDISIGGICFYSNRIFLKGQIIYLEFNQGKTPFVLEAEVVRKEQEKVKRGYKYRYGCRFINMTNHQQEIICEYIFKKELENYKKIATDR